jgi:hypothetical protein
MSTITTRPLIANVGRELSGLSGHRLDDDRYRAYRARSSAGSLSGGPEHADE